MDAVFHNVGALLTLGLGAMALASPTTAARFVNLEPHGAIGRSELRATYGGLFAALGGFALVSQAPAVFHAVGLAWAGAAAARGLSVVIDHSRSPRNLGAVAFETAIAALLLAPSPPAG